MEMPLRFSRWYILGILTLLCVFVGYRAFHPERHSILSVAFLNVGQGDAIFIEAPNGNQVLIDGGPPGQAVLSALGSVMPFYDRFLDVVISTHPDQDHVGGLPAVLEKFEVEQVLEPGISSPTPIYEAFEALVREKHISRVLARRGMAVVLDTQIYLLILFPDRDLPEVETNDASIVAKLVYGDTSFLLSGDSPRKIEEYLVTLDGELIDVDVLKAGHHGSKTSTAQPFVAVATPLYAVISAGKDNRYGHPHQETLETLKHFGADIVSTAERGTIVFQSDGKKVWMKE